MPSRDQNLAGKFAQQRAAALAHLRREMEARGLHERDGWRIVESTREAGGGIELILRPMHLRLPAPEDLECIVRIVPDDDRIDMQCEPPHAA